MTNPTPASKRSLFPVEAILSTREDGSPADRTIRFVASTTNVARDGGIVEKWDLKHYKQNSVFLWSHNPEIPPIARVTRTEMTSRGLEIDAEFAGPDQGYPFADLVYKLYRSRFLNSVSVGFRIIEEREPSEQEREAGARWVGTGELYEVSAVAVPADPGAVALGARELAGIFTRADVSTAKAQLGAIEPWQPIIRSLEAALVEPTPPVAAHPSGSEATASSSSSLAAGTLKPAWTPEQEREFTREDHPHALCEELFDLVARINDILTELHPQAGTPSGETTDGRTVSQEAARPTAVAGVGETPSAPADGRLQRLLDVLERTYSCQNRPQ